MAVHGSGAESSNSHNLPEAEEVWQRVVAYARDCLQNDRPVFTVTRSVENRITDVSEGSIGRISAQGTSNASRVTRGMVDSLWSELRGGEGVAGGEGETHLMLKEFIYREPDVALVSLKSGP